MNTDAVDELIRSALNDPLGEESPPDWASVAATLDALDARPAQQRRGRWFGASRKTWVMRGVALAAVAVGAALAVLFIPSRHASLLENAAAAIPGSGPVLHLVYASPTETISRLNVKTGVVEHERLNTRHEAWYDRERHVFKQVYRSPLGSFSEWKSRAEALDSLLGKQRLSSVQVPPEVTLFSDYKQSIARGKASYNGEGSVYGHAVFFLQIWHCVLAPFPGHPGSSLGCEDGSFYEVIAIDKHSYLPISVYPGSRSNVSGPGLRILKVELLARSAANLTKPTTPPAVARGRFGSPRVAASRQITSQAATTWLGRAPVGLRPTLAGRSLSSVLADRLSPTGAPQRRGLELLYGRSCQGKPRYHGAYVLVQEAATPEPAYNTRVSVASIPPASAVLFARTRNSYPECTAPKIGFYSGQDKSERVWGAVFRTKGLYISIFSPRRTLAVHAIRELLRGTVR